MENIKITDYMPLADSLTNRYTNSQQQFDDVIGSAYEALVKAGQNYKKDIGSFEAYARKCIYGAIMNEINEQQKHSEHVPIDDTETKYLVDPGYDPQEKVITNDLVNQLMATLKPKQQKIVYDYFVLGKSQLEISIEMKTTQSYIARILGRIILRYRDTM